MNPSTKAVLVGGAMSAGGYGYKKYKEWRGSGIQGAYHIPEPEATASGREEVRVPFAKTIVGQTACATAAGWFQVYSGGIVIDTVATRLQAGHGMNYSLWGLSHANTDVTKFVTRRAAQTGRPKVVVTAELLRRSNLFAGHFVTMLARFPYLFMNFNTYIQTDQMISRRRAPGDGFAERRKTLPEEFACISVATIISTTAITVAELPKVMDQVRAPNCTLKRTTIAGIVREHGVARVFRGFTACLGREFLFNSALLFSPPLANYVSEHFVQPNLDSSPVARALEGKELLTSSLFLGLVFGSLTNAPDQMKTNIQMGRFMNMREAFAWQLAEGGGVAGLFGKAAVYRALYIAHAVIAINFARAKVESLLTDQEEKRSKKDSDR